ncbi:MAG TPA: DUF362 domain-containing protein [Candidatus Latescibacteria bacterium]|nr:DUF362 domain-containing protein [Candidatus Latescibacterota bacterium]
MGTPYLAEDVVCVYRVGLDGRIKEQDFWEAGYRLLKAMGVHPGGRKMVFKPNVTVPAEPDSGIVTHYRFVEGMLAYLSEVGVSPEDVTIAEGPGGDPEQAWEESGYRELAGRWGVQLVNLRGDRMVTLPVPGGRVFREIGIASTVVGPGTFLANVPKMKTHNLAITTLSMKNLMGTVAPHERNFCGQSWPRTAWDRESLTPQEHIAWQWGLAERLCDLNSVVRPSLNVVEGVVGRDGTGFHRGRNIPAGLAIAGRNPVAVDAVASFLMGFAPEDIVYLRAALEWGLGEVRVERLRVFSLEEGELRPCRDLRKLRLEGRFEVITTMGPV